MQNNQIRNARMGMIVAVVIQIILCVLNIKLFGIVTGLLVIYAIYGLVKIKTNSEYWIKLQRVTTVVIILEFLFGFLVEYLFKNVI
ncbi:hypothetical protein [Ligilactobacillus aviarius]|uniref:hypothetical protein n=1 Tax=Ligilactobacillus aviarius TaxID=1606 RepID=UPI00249DF0C2|nr:hypothetical protein [Ligilactobacillus aviarius]